jgi:hypothetical protein
VRLRDAEVHDLHHVDVVASFGDHDVVRLEIAMHDAVVVRDLQAFRGLEHDQRRTRRRE